MGADDRRRWFWMLFFAFAAIYLAARLPWIACDPGVPSMWEYGYNATDEGYYLDGGKERFLWGQFWDPVRSEAYTYGFSALTHWLSYLAHLAFGLSTWTWRLPFLAIFLCGWLAVFSHVARRAGATLAFALCAAVSLTPMTLAYERTASNDAVIAALTVAAYVLAAGRAWWRVAAGGVLVGAVVLVKPSVWVLLPVVAAGVLEERGFRDGWRRLVVFAAAAAASVLVCRLAVAASLLPESASSGFSVWEIVRRTTTHYPLPPIFDFASHFKGVSSFPRDPSIQMLGPLAPLILSVPLALALRTALLRRWNGHLLLFLAVPAYVAAVSVMNTIYTHYFLPAVAALPLVVSAAVAEFEADAAPDGGWREPGWKDRAFMPFAVAVLCAAGLVVVAMQSAAPVVVQQFYSRVYNLPAKNVWGMTWPVVAVFSLALTAVLAFANGRGTTPVKAAAWAFAAAVAGSVAFAAWPAAQLAPYMKKAAGDYFAPLAVSTVVSALALLAVFGPRRAVVRRGAVAVGAGLMFAAAYLAVPGWRAAAAELLRPGTRLHAQAAKEIAALVPENAVVVGERSNQMLMSLPIRTATTFPANSDPMPVVRAVRKADPGAKLFALVDTQHAYNLQHYREHADEVRLRLVKTLKMPSFSSGALCDVHLCEILPVRAKAK